jgi:hypothetical protein
MFKTIRGAIREWCGYCPQCNTDLIRVEVVKRRVERVTYCPYDHYLRVIIETSRGDRVKLYSKYRLSPSALRYIHKLRGGEYGRYSEL